MTSRGLGALIASLRRGLIGSADIDRALVRLFARGIAPATWPGWRRVPRAGAGRPIDTRRTGAGAAGGERSLVLLKNEGVLPLKAGLKLAVIGPLADATRVLRGNYSSTNYRRRRCRCLRACAACCRRRSHACARGASMTDGDPVPASALRTPDGRPGLRADYYNRDGAQYARSRP